MVKMTVVMCTKRRLPHFEWALESLKNQKYKDFEYIIVDGLYDNRKDEVNELIKNMNVDFPVLYIPDKPSRWRGKRPALCNARNTALIFAKGDYVAFHDDNCKMPDNWLERHAVWMDKGYMVAGNWLAFQDTDKDGKGVIGAFGWEYRSTILKSACETTGGWLYGGNFGFPIKIVDEINGFDEYLDGEMGQDDISLGIRAQRKGYKVMYDPSCYVEYYYKEHGLLMNSNDPNNPIWKDNFVEMNIIPVNIRLRDGKEHFSNEFAIQELLEDSKRFWTKGNVVQIKGSREMWKSGKYSIVQMYRMMEGWIDCNLVDWRDGKLVADKIK